MVPEITLQSKLTNMLSIYTRSVDSIDSETLKAFFNWNKVPESYF